jgi:hypothetical protein
MMNFSCSCEAATIGKFRQINSLIDNEHSTADQKRMFPLKVLQITSTSVELEWDMTAVVDSPTLSSFLLPSSKSDFHLLHRSCLLFIFFDHRLLLFSQVTNVDEHNDIVLKKKY